jgi:uroporphyrinogen-III synthase
MEQPADWVILTTGIGTETLLTKAEELGLREELLTTLKSVRIAARGYKTVQALRKLGLEPEIQADDGTTAGVLRALQPYPLEGQHVILQLYGDPAPRMMGALALRGALCEEWMPYRHVPPEDGAVDELLDEAVRGEVDAIVFTSTVQVRYALQRADKRGMRGDFLRALDSTVVAAPIGKVTAEALKEEGVQRMMIPKEERLGFALLELGRFFQGTIAEAASANE